ncbi:MAG: hypothetical protein HYX92_19935 [Chloroflexi bacterium]|nr:hypothetical protein [Chloroflexota bacterium]
MTETMARCIVAEGRPYTTAANIIALGGVFVMADYHGQKHQLEKGAEQVPPRPAEVSATDAGTWGTGSYAHVRMIGHYGLLCVEKQTLDFHRVTLAQARQLRWDYYGVCGAQMTCYDAQGNVVHEE